MSLFDELKRRNVFRVGIAYLVGGWLLLQLTEVLSELLDLPDVVGRAIVLIVAIGLPVALFFAWAFELTPEGVKREAEVDRSQSITPHTGKKLNNTILVMLALAVVYLLYDKFSGELETGSGPLVQNTPVVAAKAGTSSTPEAVTRHSIAVLPFDNRSNREEDQFFTDGIHDDLLTTIAKIGSMKVISRTSVMEYKNTTKKIPEIAKELGVATVLEGGIQRSGNQVRINVQLIDAQTDEHLWAEIYDRQLTAENLFAMQSEITRAIADALQATLSPEELERVDSAPTNNLLANEYYLRGRQLMATRESDNLEQAIAEFQKALELDPNFALAWVGMSDSLALSTVYGTLTREESYTPREKAVQRALEIDEHLGEAYASLGLVHTHKGEFEQAESAFRKAIALSPNYSSSWHWLSWMLYNNFPLRADESIVAGQKAVELDPRSAVINGNLGGAYEARGLYTTAEQQYLRGLDMHPDSAIPLRNLAQLYAGEFDRYDKALPYTLKALERSPSDLSSLYSLAWIFSNTGLLSRAEKLISSMDLDPESPDSGWWELHFNMRRGNQAGALESINWLLPRVSGSKSDMQNLAAYEFALGNPAKARELYLAAEPGWLDPAQWEALINQYQSTGCLAGWTLMSTGDEDLGRKLVDQTTYFLEVTLPAAVEHADAYDPDQCYLAQGNYDKALQALQTQLDHNHLFEPWVYKLKAYDPIRLEPGFLAIVEENQRRLEEQQKAIETIMEEAEA